MHRVCVSSVLLQNVKYVLTTLPRHAFSTLPSSFPSSTKAAVFAKHGEPAKVIKIETQELPKELQPHEAAIKILATPVNPSDINQIEGTYGQLPPLPAVAGNEGVAIVEAVGSDVKGIKVGDHVVAAKSMVGTWRSHAIVDADRLDPVPKELPIPLAATICVNPFTAYLLLRQFVKMKKGDVVVQNGGNSTVGRCVIQLAKRMGIKTISTVYDQEPNVDDVIEHLKKLGGTVVLKESQLKDKKLMKSVIMQMPKQRSPLALNSVGGPAATTLLPFLGVGAQLVSFGAMSKKPLVMPTGPFIFRDFHMHGFWLTNWINSHSTEERRKVLLELASLLTQGKLEVKLAPVPFEKLPELLVKPLEGVNGVKALLTF